MLGRHDDNTRHYAQRTPAAAAVLLTSSAEIKDSFGPMEGGIADAEMLGGSLVSVVGVLGPTS